MKSSTWSELSGTRLDRGTAGGWPLRTGPGSARSSGGLLGLSVGVVKAVMVASPPVIMQLKFQEFFEFDFLVTLIQFMVRVLGISVMPQRHSRTVPNSAGGGEDFTGAVLG